MSDKRKDQEGQEPEKPSTSDKFEGNWQIKPDGSLLVDGHEVASSEPPGYIDDASGLVEVLGRQFSPADLENLVQQSEESAEKIRQAEEMRAALEPYEEIFRSDAFAEFLQDRIESGELPAPKYRRATPEDTAAFHKRSIEPGSAAVRQAMREYASTLPKHEADLYDKNPGAFVELYDRMRKAMGPMEGPSMLDADRLANAPILDHKERLKYLQRKEVPQLERPGPARSVAADSRREEAKRMKKITEWAAQGDQDSLVEIAKTFFRTKDDSEVPPSGF